MPYQSTEEQIGDIISVFDFHTIAKLKRKDSHTLREQAGKLLKEAEREWRKQCYPSESYRLEEDGFFVFYDGMYFRLAYELESVDGCSLDPC